MLAVEQDPCAEDSSCQASDWDAAHELEEQVESLDDGGQDAAGASFPGAGT